LLPHDWRRCTRNDNWRGVGQLIDHVDRNDCRFCPGGPLAAGDLDVAGVAENLEVAEMVEAGDDAIATDERLNVVHFELEGVSGVGQTGDGVFADYVRFEAAALTGPLGAATCSPARGGPHVVIFEGAGVLVAAVGGASGRQRRATALEAADSLVEVNAGDVGAPAGGFELGQRDLPLRYGRRKLGRPG